MLDMPIISGSTMSAASKICYTAAGLLLGRKVFWAINYKTCGYLANLMGKENVAEWNQTSQDYWTRAKKDTFQDLTATTAFITMGLVSGNIGTALLKEEQKKVEPGYIQNYTMPILKGLYNHKGKITGIGILAGIGYQCSRGISPEQRRMAEKFVQEVKKTSEESVEHAMKFITGNKSPSSTTSTESSPWSSENMAKKWLENAGKDSTTLTKSSPWSPESLANKWFENIWKDFDSIKKTKFSS